MKVVAAADLHLDATSVGRWNAEKDVHDNWIESFGRLADIVQLCNDEEAELLVVSGDVFHTGRPPAEAVARTVDTLSRLARTKVVLVNGNHDQTTVVGGHRTPIDAYLKGQPWCYAAAAEPTVVEYDGLALALHPWPRVAGSSQLDVTNRTLADTIAKLGEEMGDRPGLFAAHVVVNECSFDSGKRGTEVAMTTSVLEASVPTDIIDAGPWALARLGHIHKRQQLSPKTGYVGSSYKVSFGEEGEPKGVDVIEFAADGTAQLRFHQFTGRELYKVDLSTGAGGGESVPEQVKHGDIVRFVLDAEGTPKEFTKAVKVLERLKVEYQVYRNPKERVEGGRRTVGLSLDTDPTAALRAYMEQQQVGAERQKQLMREFADLSATR